jgi:DNA-binding transcriptional LysR family regulator
MSLTKTVTIDQITITENGIVLYREATRIMEDGTQLSQTYHRSSLVPESDLTGVPANVAAICNLTWTPEVIAAYKAQQEANKLGA